MRFGSMTVAVTAALLMNASAPLAQAGLVNPTSTVNPFYEFPPAVVAPSTVFNTGAPGPFSLAAPINPPIHTTEPFNISANAGFFFTDTQVTIYNNLDPPTPFCSDNLSTGSSCADSHQTFDFVFTNEDITKVAVDPSSSPISFRPHSVRIRD
jgi:hypothetical protein